MARKKKSVKSSPSKRKKEYAIRPRYFNNLDQVIHIVITGALLHLRGTVLPPTSSPSTRPIFKKVISQLNETAKSFTWQKMLRKKHYWRRTFCARIATSRRLWRQVM